MTDDISWNDLLDLVARFDSGNYDDVAVQFGDVSLRMSRTGSIADAPAAVAVAVPPSHPVSVPASPIPPSESAADPSSNEIKITSPMVGVFYRHPSPGAPPFVEVGQAIDPDTTVGIVEIMKLMNPVKAGVSGILREFTVDDGQGVEFGQTLALLDAGPS